MLETLARKTGVWYLLRGAKRGERPHKSLEKQILTFCKRIATCGVLFLTGLTVYHYFFNDKIEIFYHASPLFERCVAEIEELRRGRFAATFYMPFRWMQIIQGNKFENCYSVNYVREVMKARDGENIVLDWVPLEADARGEAQNAPLVIILAGATGTSNCSYVKAQVIGLRERGFRTVSLNQRGSILPQITTKIFNVSHLLDDLDDTVAYIHGKHPDSRIYLMGFSMGASVALKFAAISPHAHLINGVATIGNPFNFYKAVQTTYQLKNALYGDFLMRKLRQRILHNEVAIRRFEEERGVSIDFPSIIKARTAFELDDRFNKHVYAGFKSPEEYYNLVSCLPYLAQVKVPVLVIHSKNDPICEFRHVPVELLKSLPNYLLVFTPKGSHVEFFVGKKMKRWNVAPVANFLNIVEEEVGRPAQPTTA